MIYDIGSEKMFELCDRTYVLFYSSFSFCKNSIIYVRFYSGLLFTRTEVRIPSYRISLSD